MKYLFLFLISSATLQAQKSASLKPFHWLLGTWKVDSSDIFVKWTLADDTMITGLTYENEYEPGPDEYEFKVLEAVRLVSRGGKFYYVAAGIIGKGKPVEFEIVSVTKNSFTAQNKTFDFPQRIVYKCINPKEFSIVMEGKENNRKKTTLNRFLKPPE